VGVVVSDPGSSVVSHCVSLTYTWRDVQGDLG
jgi:hypothetical protein